jgi:hypothetical protein
MAELIRGWVGLMSNLRQFDRATGFLLPPPLDEWLSRDRRGDRRVGPVGDGKELYGSGSAGYHPALLLGLLVYGYTKGFCRAASWSGRPTVAFRFSAANDHPDHDTIATFRRRRPETLLADNASRIIPPGANGLLRRRKTRHRSKPWLGPPCQ